MTSPTWIPETTLPDREGNPAVVREGDKVTLPHIDSVVDELAPGTEEEYLAKQHQEFLQRWLGDGPYEISNIGRWPCGRVTIYVKTARSSGAGVHPRDLVYCGTASQAARDCAR